jgi:hypothetical protein
VKILAGGKEYTDKTYPKYERVLSATIEPDGKKK